MEIQHTTDSGLVVASSSASDSLSMRSVGIRPIISVKEARKLLGNNLSSLLNDVDLMGVVGLMSHLADELLEQENVPQEAKVSV